MLHFGADLGPDLPDLSLLGDAVPHSALDVPVTLGLIPQASSGWRGRPGLRGHRNGQAFSARLRVVSVERSVRAAAAGAADCSPSSPRPTPTPVSRVRTEIRINDGGLLQLRHRLTNDGAGRLQRRGTRRRAARGPRRHGNPGPDRPLVPGVPPPAPSAAPGHLGPLGPARPDRPRRLAPAGRRHRRVREPPRAGLGRAPGLERQPRELRRRRRRTAGPSSAPRNCSAPARSAWPASASYETPWLFAAYSAAGLDGISEAFYAWFRGRPHHPGVRVRQGPARGAQRLGGGLLRPPASSPCSSSPSPPPGSALNATCSTTAGSAAAATITPALATGTSTRTSGPTASRR